MKLREALRFVEADLRMVRDTSGLPLPPILILDGLESFAALANSSDVGRRAVSVFVAWLARLSSASIARPLLTADGAFFLESFVFPAKLRDVLVVTLSGMVTRVQAEAICEKPLKSLWPLDDALSLHVAELAILRDEGNLEKCVVLSKTRYAAALSSSEPAMRFAPLGRCRADVWTHDELRQLLELALSNTPLADASPLLSSSSLIALLRSELLEIDATSLTLCLPRVADRIAVRDLLSTTPLAAKPSSSVNPSNSSSNDADQ